MRKQIKKIREIPAEKAFDALGLIVILAGLITAVRMNLAGRSLWYDEAALAYSFCTRDLADLIRQPLALVQSAPVGWLYLVKIFTVLFGQTDFVMRIPSILFYAGTLFLAYKLLAQYYQVTFPLMTTAFIASIPVVLQYANVFKPYMADCFFALLVLYVFANYETRKINEYVLMFVWAGILWFSSPSCFVMGGILLVRFLMAIIRRQKKEIRMQIRTGICIICSFSIHYILWLSKIDDGMSAFWAGCKMPLLITSLEDWKQLLRMTHTLFRQFYRLEWGMLVCIFLGIFYALVKRNEKMLDLYGIYIVTSFASSIGKYPVNRRLWLFMYPLLVMLAVQLVDNVLQNGKWSKYKNILAGLSILVVTIVTAGIRYYWKADNIYWPGYEVKGEYAYLKEVIQEDDGVYVARCAMPMFLFYNHYDTDHVYDKDNEVFIAETSFRQNYDGSWNDHTEDYAFILSHDTCYIILSDTWDDEGEYTELYDRLRDEGELEIVYDVYDTPMMKFTRE